MLHPVVNSTGEKAWCGPTVVSAITGADIVAVKALIKRYRGSRRAVKGTSWYELQAVLRSLGWDMTLSLNAMEERPTLAQWYREHRAFVREHRPDLKRAIYIVNVTNHWVVVGGQWFCDTFTKGHPVRFTQAPRKRKRVEKVYAVTRLR